MANQHGAAFKVVDGVCEGIDGLDVQVIGRLVQEEQVGVLHGQPGEGHAALLAVRQVLDGARLDTQPQALAPSLLSDWFKYWFYRGSQQRLCNL